MPEEFHTSDGTTVLVGKNNLQNDRLSFKVLIKMKFGYMLKISQVPTW